MKAPPPVLLPIHPHQFDRHDSRDWRQVNIDLASREVLKLNFQSLCSAPELVGAEHATQGPDKGCVSLTLSTFPPYDFDTFPPCE